VRYNFSATSPNMLTIKVGDEVEILGRSGEQRGWWKGKSNGKVSGQIPNSILQPSIFLLPGWILPSELRGRAAGTDRYLPDPFLKAGINIFM
jgi:SH3 domain